MSVNTKLPATPLRAAFSRARARQSGLISAKVTSKPPSLPRDTPMQPVPQQRSRSVLPPIDSASSHSVSVSCLGISAQGRV